MGKSVFSSDSKCFQLARDIAVCLLLVTGVTIVGCGPNVAPRDVDIKGGVKADEESKIRGYLDAAGVNGEIASIQSEEKEWIVDVGAPPAKPGKRQAPVMPYSVRVDKATGKVTTGGANN